MKKYVQSTSNTMAMLFTVDVIYSLKEDTSAIAASAYTGPRGPVISGDKNAEIDAQEEADYWAFIETIEDLLEEHHELKLVYKSQSEDFSKYYSFLAQDALGNTLFKFRLRLRISNHVSHSTKRQKANKAAERKAVAPYLNGKKPETLTKIVVVNNNKYNDYLDAYMYIREEVARWIKIMQR